MDPKPLFEGVLEDLGEIHTSLDRAVIEPTGDRKCFFDRTATKVSLSTGAADHQYGSCRVSYVDPGSGKCIEGTYSANEEETGQCLEISAKVSDEGEAKALAEKRLRLHNRLTRFASFSFPGDPALVASVTVQLEGWGGWDGKYIIKRAVHTVDTSGYTTKINARRCLEGY